MSNNNLRSRETTNYRSHLAPVCYALGLLGASLMTFGWDGLWVGGAILATWAWVFFRSPHVRGLQEALFAWIVLFALIRLLTPQVYDSREAPPATACANNLKQIALALLNYQARYGTLPPAYVAAEDGRPMHSWRVLILPFLEYDELYAQYRFDEPWDGPNNRELAASMPAVFACPSDKRGAMSDNTKTNYLAVVGPTTLWPGRQALPVSAAGSDRAYTILVLESRSEAVEWMRPSDLDSDTAVRLLTEEPPLDWHISKSFFYNCYSGRHAAFITGAIVQVGPMSRASAEAMLSINNQEYRESGVYRSISGVCRPNYGNWFSLGIFLLLTALPLPWVFMESNR